MAKDLLSRYIWIVDTIRRYGTITRSKLNELWRQTSFSQKGEDLPRRTFYTYRQAIEDVFNIRILCNPATFEYSIEETTPHRDSITDMMLNTMSMNNILTDSTDISDRIFLEDIPSSREFFGIVIEAIKRQIQLRIDYLPFNRALPDTDIVIEPYLLKLFRQRWYVAARRVDEQRIRIYALDRFKQATFTDTSFEIDPDFDKESYFNDSFGVIVDQSEPKRVRIKASVRQAKYLRSLPLHHSQREVIHDSYSLFSYNIRLTPDFIGELLSMGSEVTVVEPLELKVMIVDKLQNALRNYRPLSK